MVKKVHLKKLDPSRCLIDLGLKWIYASLNLFIFYLSQYVIYIFHFVFMSSSIT